MLLMALLWAFAGQAQTDKMRSEITKSVNQDRLKTLQKQLQLQNSKNETAVAVYLKKNPTIKRTFVKNGSVYYLQRIDADGKPVYINTKNKASGELIKADQLYSGGSIGVNITGTGMVAGIWDGGQVRASHELLTGKVAMQTNQTLDGSTSNYTGNNHQTHVSGTIVGKDIANQPSARGIAHGATALNFDFSNDLAEMTTFAAGGYLVSNHSYGAANDNTVPVWRFGAYDSEARDWDILTKNSPNYLPFVAAGNEQQSNGNSAKSGYDLITGATAAKNVVTVGAVNGDKTMSNYSNWGPTDDGRVKPDIVAKGTGINSSHFADAANTPSDNAYSGDGAGSSGTSYSTPAVTASALLLQQYYNSLHGTYMKASTLKALLLGTAEDLGQPGPDHKFGWGLLNIEKAAKAIKTKSTEGNPTGQSAGARPDLTRGSYIEEITYNLPPYISTDPNRQEMNRFVIAKGGEPLIISFAWTDEQGTEQTSANGTDPTTSRLVHEFDMLVRISSPFSDTRPWKPSGMTDRTAAAGVQTGWFEVNNNNYKQVIIPNPVAGGEYRIVIRKSATSPATLMPLSLVVTGTALAAPTASAQTRCANQTVASLVATGTDIKWYTTATEVTALATTTLLTAGTYYASQTVDGTESTRTAVVVTVNALPGITLGSISSVLPIATSFSIPYTATTGNPNQYSLVAGTPTAMPSFSAINNAALGSSPISVTIPASAANTYNFNLTVRNSGTGCVSAAVPVALVVTVANSLTIDGIISPTNCTTPNGSIVFRSIGYASTTQTLSYRKDGTATTASVMVASNGAISLTGLGAGVYSEFAIGSVAATGSRTLNAPSYSFAIGSGTNPTTCSGTNGSIGFTYDSGNIPNNLYTMSYLNGTTPETKDVGFGVVVITSPGNRIAAGASAPLTATLSGLGAGSYSNFKITVNGCEVTATGSSPVVLSDPAVPTFAVGTKINPTTCGGTEGSIQLTGLTASTSYSVSYQKNAGTAVVADISSNALGQLLIPSLGTGSYTNITVTRVGCTSAAATATLIDPAKPTINLSTISAICAGAASFTIPYFATTGSTYSISGTGITSVSDGNLQGSSITVNLSSPASGSTIAFTLTVKNTTTNCVSEPIMGSVAVLNTATPVATGATICVGGSSTLTATGCSGAELVLKWYKTTDNSLVTMPVSPTANTQYYAKCEQTLNNVTCASAASSNVTVTVNPLPTAGISGTTAVCQNAPFPTVTFTGSNGTAPYTFTYKINGGADQTITTTTGNSVTVAQTTATVGDFTYTLVSVKDASSTQCSQSQNGTVKITVNALPVVSTPQTALCTGLTMTLSPTSGGTWQSSNPSIASIDAEGIVTAFMAGVVSFTFTQTSTGCSAATASVTIKPTPTSALSASKVDVCANERVTLTPNCSIPTSTVNWNPGGPTVTPAAATLPYVYRARCAADGCVGNETEVEVRTHRILVDMKDLDVGALPKAIVRAVKDNMAPTNQINAPVFPRRWTFIANGCDASEAAVFKLSGPVNFNTIDNAATYAMFANDAGGFYSIDHPNYGNGGSFPNGTYSLTIDLRSADGVGGPFPKNRVATGSLLATRTLQFTVNNSQSMAGRQSAVGEELTVEGERRTAAGFAEVFPNPVSHSLRLKVVESKDQKVNVSLMDASGRTMFQRSFVPQTNQHQEEFEVSQLSSGMYFLRINTENKNATLKVVKVD